MQAGKRIRVRWPTVAGFGAIVLWSLFPITARLVNGVPPLEIDAIGFGIASLSGLMMLLLTGRLSELKQRPVVWVHGVGGVFGFNALIFAAMALAPPTQAVAINYSWPLFTVILSALVLRTRLSMPHLVGLTLGFAGCLLLAYKSATSGFDMAYLPGYLCALASSLIWASYSALSCKLGNVPSGALAGIYAVVAALSGALTLIFDHVVIPDARSAFGLLLLGLGPMGMAYFMWDFGVKRGNPVFLGALSYLCPAMSYLFLVFGGFAPIGLSVFAAVVLMISGGGIAAQGKTGSILKEVKAAA